MFISLSVRIKVSSQICFTAWRCWRRRGSALYLEAALARRMERTISGREHLFSWWCVRHQSAERNSKILIFSVQSTVQNQNTFSHSVFSVLFVCRFVCFSLHFLKIFPKWFFKLNNNLFLTSPVQNDHLATEGQAADPAKQGQGVPPEVHKTLLLNSYSHFSSIQ